MCVQVILLAELVCDWDAGEILAPVTLDGVNVEENGQGGQETQEDQDEDTDLDPLPVHIRTPKAEVEKKTFIDIYDLKLDSVLFYVTISL